MVFSYLKKILKIPQAFGKCLQPDSLFQLFADYTIDFEVYCRCSNDCIELFQHALILLIFPAFFAASELSVLLIRPSKVLRFIEEKKEGAYSILKIQKRFRSSLIASQFGVTISLIAIGWLSSGLANHKWQGNTFENRLYDLIVFLIIVTI